MNVDKYTATFTEAMDIQTTSEPSDANQSLHFHVQIHAIADFNEATVTISSTDNYRMLGSS